MVAYRIVTPRLVLRCWQPSDAQRLHGVVAANLAALRPWIPWAAREPLSLADRIESLRQARGRFDLDRDHSYGVFDPGEQAVLGGGVLLTRAGPGAREIGYWLDQAHAGQGLATELAAALSRVAFEVARVDRVEIHCEPENARSAAVARRLGYRHEATLPRRLDPVQGEGLRDLMLWTMFADDYPGSPAARVPAQAFDVTGGSLR
jgi:RimJ/RimL family protein N-acetyltransferase